MNDSSPTSDPLERAAPALVSLRAASPVAGSADAPGRSPAIAAIFAAVMGALVLIGWSLDAAGLKSVLPGLEAMTIEAALCFILSGAGLLLVQAPSPRPAQRWLLLACVALTLGVSLSAIAGYVFDRPRIWLEPDAGPMAPNTALGFTLCGIALLILMRRTATRLATAMAAALGVVIVFLGGAAVVGYMADAAFGYRWGELPAMAVHSAAAFVLLGMALVSLVARQQAWNWTLERTTTACFATGLLLLLGVGALTARTLSSFERSTGQVASSHRILGELGNLQREIAESGLARREFRENRAERQRIRYEASAKSAREALMTLRSLTAANPRQQARVDAIIQIFARALWTVFGLTAPAPSQAAPASNASGETEEPLGVQYIRLATAISAEEKASLHAREELTRRMFDRALFVVPLGTFGSLFLLSVALFLLNRESGERQRSVVTLRDAEQQLRDSEKRYRVLFERSPLPMWVYDLETLRFVTVNEAAIDFYGYSAAEFLAMRITEIRPPSELPALLEDLAKTPPARSRSGIWQHRKKDGTIVLMDITSHDLTVDGRRNRLVLANDVTERVHAEQALRESEERTRAVLNSALSAVVVIDRAGYIIDWNPKAEAMFGWAREEALGRELGETIIPPAFRERHHAGMRHFLATGEGPVLNRLIELSALRRDGSEFPVELSISPLQSGGEVTFCGFVSDITARKQAEAQIRGLNEQLEQRIRERTAQLEEANRELESFSYSVSHDLRAPLRHVQGYVAMLERNTGGQLSEKAQHYVKTINDASVEMGQLIDDLLDFSRMGRTEMSEERVDLGRLVREAIERLEGATRGGNIEWKIAPLPNVLGDAAMLRQVMSNLIGNAVKYTRQRDRPVIEIACAGEEDGRMVFCVRDNGAGFDMRYVHKLFGVFQRLHRADEFEGTGIGLATVRRIIARHGGRVWAEGAPGQGASFYFTLRAIAAGPA